MAKRLKKVEEETSGTEMINTIQCYQAAAAS